MANTEARDYFEQTFAEKLWAMVPEAFRDEDGVASPPGVLRGFIETLATQAAILRRSQDKLWDDQFIELCSEWAVPYIGDLVGTRMVSALNRRARRIDVAKTIYYRQRAGTPRVLEELAADIADWEGKVVEEFRRLARCRHGLDPNPNEWLGRFTGTPPGGWADLRNTRGAELADGPFDEFHHLPDMRRPHDRDGRYGIPNLAFHLYRLASTPLNGIEPKPGPVAGSFTFDPSGRDLPLYIRRHRTDDREIAEDRQKQWEDWRTAQEWELPGPMTCHVLNHAEFVITAAALIQLQPALVSPGGLSNTDAATAVAQLMRFRDYRFPTEAQLRTITGTIAASYAAALQVEAVWKIFLQLTLVAECGKRGLLPAGGASTDTAESSVYVKVGTTVAARENVVAGNLANWTLSVTQREWAIDPARGRLLWVGSGAAPAPRLGYYYGFSGPIGAGGYDRSASIDTAATTALFGGGSIPATDPSTGVMEISDSRTYTPVGGRNNVSTLELRAADRQRPYLALAADWVFDTGAQTNSTLLIDGLWIGATGANRTIELKGDYATVTLRHVTLDPGGQDSAGGTIPVVTLTISGNVDRLVIENSIVGPIRVASAGTLDRLEISDSIVDATNDASRQAIVAAETQVSLERVTVFGGLDLEWLYASEAIITGFTDVTNTQDGCFRFSAVLERKDPSKPESSTNPHSRVPRPFESHFVPSFTGYFTSTVFGQPGYAQLGAAAPENIQRGAENGSELGAFSSLINPIKADSLRAKVDEFAPFGVLPFYPFET
jgi:hypothetical protein